MVSVDDSETPNDFEIGKRKRQTPKQRGALKGASTGTPREPRRPNSTEEKSGSPKSRSTEHRKRPMKKDLSSGSAEHLEAQKRPSRSKSEAKPSLKRANTEPERNGEDGENSQGSKEVCPSPAPSLSQSCHAEIKSEKHHTSEDSEAGEGPPRAPLVPPRVGPLVTKTEGGVTIIIFARFEAIIEIAMDPDHPDNDQVLSTLLYTYPFFATGHKILEAMVERMDSFAAHRNDSDPVRGRLYYILSKWLTAQYNWEIDDDKTLSRSIEKLVKGRIAEDNKQMADELDRELKRVQYMRPAGVQVVDLKALAHNPQAGPHFNSIDFKTWMQDRSQRGGGDTKRRNLIRRARTAVTDASPALVVTTTPSGGSLGSGEETDTAPRATLAGLAHRVFTINFQDSKKSVILNDAIRAQPLRDYLGTVCQQRGITVDAFVPEDLNRKALSLDILVGEIPGGEIFFCTTPETTKERNITIHLEGPENLNINIRKETEDSCLYQILESALEFSLETPGAVQLPPEIKLKEISEDVEVLHLKLTKTDVKARKTLGSRALSVFAEGSLKNLPPELIAARKKFLRDPACKSSVLAFRADELAQAMTAIEHELFVNIPPCELIGAEWKKKNKSKITPHVVAMVHWFNRLTNWLRSDILLGTTPKERAAIIERLVSTAQYCKLFKNYNSMIGIVSALNGQAIHRLKHTWAEVPAESRESYAKLEKYFSPVDNYTKLRKIHTEMMSDRVKSPAIPYIGIILGDLLSLDEIPAITDDGYVNWSKMQRVAVNFQLVRLLQRKKYDFDEFNSQAQDLMEFMASDSLVLLTDAEQFSWSRLLEEPKKKKGTQ